MSLRSACAAATVALACGIARTAPADVRLTRGPYLQLLTTTAVTVVWNTDAPAGCSVAIRRPERAARVVAGDRRRVCAVRLTGLTPGEAYTYVPQADGAALGREATFRTDHPDRPFSFAVLGDSGSADASELAVVHRVASRDP